VSLRRAIVTVLVSAAVMASAACTSEAPVASNAVPPPAGPQPRVVYAALGGDETLLRGLDTNVRRAWTQQVFTSLPPSAVYVNLATEDAPVAEGLHVQLEQALALQPTVATVWFGGADDPAVVSQQEFASQLRGIVTGLQAANVRVVVVGRPGGRGSSFTATAQQVAVATGARFADVAGGSGPRDPGAQDAIATAVEAQIRG
jgi:hypothetical protein